MNSIKQNVRTRWLVTTAAVFMPILAVGAPGAALGQQMGPSVTIAGPFPLPVKIPGPVPVKNIDERGRNPFMVSVHCESTSANVCGGDTPQVPMGKRLVVEHVNSTAQLRDPAGVSAWEVFVHSSSGAVVASLTPHLVIDTGQANFVANESVLLFVEAGQTMTAQIVATGVGVNMDMLFSGYFVDLSQ
jgi:hypothetical protein